MMNFEDNLPRTLNYENPISVTEPSWYPAEYKKMVRKCMFPAGFGNGLFNMMLGIWVCIAGLSCMLVGDVVITPVIPLSLGAIGGLILMIVYGSHMQSRILFPRGGCLPFSTDKAKTSTWLLPLIVYISIAAWSVYAGHPLAVTAVVAVVFGCIELLAYSRCNRSSMILVSALLVLLPIGMAYLGISYSSDPFTAIVLAIPNAGIVLVICGTWHSQTSVNRIGIGGLRETIAKCLASNESRSKFVGSSFLCMSIDCNLTAQLLQCCHDDDRVVACTAQIALGNIWGPIPREALLPDKPKLIDGVDDERAERFYEQFTRNRDMTVSNWRDHFVRVDKILLDIAKEDGTAAENLYALASGENMLYAPGRVVAVEMLGAMRTPKAYSLLMTLLQHRDKLISDAAIVGFYGAESRAILYLERFFAANHPWQRIRAIKATRCLLDYLAVFDKSDHEIAKALLEPDVDGLLDAEDTNTFAMAISLLPCDSQEDIEVLEEYCANRRPIIRIVAMYSLSKHNPEVAARWVVPALNDHNPAVRYAAVKCIVKMRLTESETYFRRLTDDPDPKVAQAATTAMRKLERASRPTQGW